MMKKVLISLLALALVSANAHHDKLPFVSWSSPKFDKAREIIKSVESGEVLDHIKEQIDVLTPDFVAIVVKDDLTTINMI